MPPKTLDSSIHDFAQAVGLLVRRARAAGSSQDLSWTESGVLKRLAQLGPATTAELARHEGMKPQSMRTVIASLEQMGMVARKPHPTDGRQVNLVLTTKGAATHKSVGEAKRSWFAHSVAKLNNQERETLFAAGAIIRKILKNED